MLLTTWCVVGVMRQRAAWDEHLGIFPWSRDRARSLRIPVAYRWVEGPFSCLARGHYVLSEVRNVHVPECVTLATVGKPRPLPRVAGRVGRGTKKPRRGPVSLATATAGCCWFMRSRSSALLIGNESRPSEDGALRIDAPLFVLHSQYLMPRAPFVPQIGV